MPTKLVLIPAPWVTAPAPATAPEMVNVFIALSTSVSATLPPIVPRITPSVSLTVSVKSSVTAAVSALATGASFTLVSFSVTLAIVLFPAASTTVTAYVWAGDPSSKLFAAEAAPAAVIVMTPALLI